MGLGSGTFVSIMFDPTLATPPESVTSLAAGSVLLNRGSAADRVVHVVQGRVVLGVMAEGLMAHQLGVVEGPFWLEAASALLGLPHVVDALAETDVQLRFVPVPDFLAQVKNLPKTSQN